MHFHILEIQKFSMGFYSLQVQMKTSTSRPGPNTSAPKVKEQKEVKEPGKKKLFLTDGWQVPCTGICIYMFRYKHNIMHLHLHVSDASVKLSLD